jgi:acyl carrier protein
MSNIDKKIIEVLASVLGMESSQIPLNASPDTLDNWDSIKHMNLIIALEEEFSIRFPDELIERLVSLDLIQANVQMLTKEG